MFINAPFSHLLTHFNFILRDNINQNIVSSRSITPTRLLSGNWDSTASSFKLIDTWSMHVLFLEAASEINRPWFHFWMNTYYKGSGLRFSNIWPMNNMNLSKSGKHREEYPHRAKMLIWKTHLFPAITNSFKWPIAILLYFTSKTYQSIYNVKHIESITPENGRVLDSWMHCKNMGERGLFLGTSITRLIFSPRQISFDFLRIQSTFKIFVFSRIASVQGY